MQIRGRLPGESTVSDVTVSDGRITAVKTTDVKSEDAVIVCPGFIDIQMNGFGGIAFNDPEPDIDARIDRLITIAMGGGDAGS